MQLSDACIIFRIHVETLEVRYWTSSVWAPNRGHAFLYTPLKAEALLAKLPHSSPEWDKPIIVKVIPYLLSLEGNP